MRVHPDGSCSWENSLDFIIQLSLDTSWVWADPGGRIIVKDPKLLTMRLTAEVDVFPQNVNKTDWTGFPNQSYCSTYVNTSLFLLNRHTCCCIILCTSWTYRPVIIDLIVIANISCHVARCAQPWTYRLWCAPPERLNWSLQTPHCVLHQFLHMPTWRPQRVGRAAYRWWHSLLSSLHDAVTGFQGDMSYPATPYTHELLQWSAVEYCNELQM